MVLKDISFDNAQENIDYDLELLEAAECGVLDETLRFWELNKIAVILGRTSNPDDEVKTDETAKDDIDIVRRRSGGCTILQGPGCLNYSLILSFDKDPALKDIRESYKIIMGKLLSALNDLGINAEFKGLSDIALNGRKISGNAQFRRKKYMLHHGTMLYDFSVELIEKYLKMPKKRSGLQKRPRPY